MIEFLDLGSGPSEEDIAQVGSEDYSARSWKEARAYRDQLRRSFGEEPDGAKLLIKNNPHDFGNYLSVVCAFNGSKEATDYAFTCESRGPAYWDKEACEALGLEWSSIDRRQ